MKLNWCHGEGVKNNPANYRRLAGLELTPSRPGSGITIFLKPVIIVVDAFMEKDEQKKSHWYPMTKGQYIQGLLSREGDEQRVYVVTIAPTEPDQLDVHNRWPRIVLSPSYEVSFG